MPRPSSWPAPADSRLAGAAAARANVRGMEHFSASEELITFGRLLLIVAVGFMLSILANKLSVRIQIPAPALLLLTAAVAAELFDGLKESLSIESVEQIATIALILILFDGGMHVGWKRFKAAAMPIMLVGILGTFATAALIACAAHFLLDLSWILSWIIGAALAPTDPAVMFSVLGNREVGGRSGTVLQGESGVNDPVAIALMIGLLEFATSDEGSVVAIVEEFAVEMSVGAAIGIVGGLLLAQFIKRVSLPNEALYSLRTLAAAGIIYGAAATAHGSGFLAVFIAGILIGDQRAPYKAQIKRFHSSLGSLAEIVVFVVLGVTIELSDLGGDRLWLDGLILAVLLAFIIRPLVVGGLLLPTSLRRGERFFIMWSGLKGAVPIVLGAFALLAAVDGAERVYAIVFVVVAFSVIFQGSTVPLAARRFGVPMEEVEPEPWDLSVRLQREPRDVERFFVASGSAADGRALRDLPLAGETWITLLLRDGHPAPAHGAQVIQSGDELLVITEAEDVARMRALFTMPAEEFAERYAGDDEGVS